MLTLVVAVAYFAAVYLGRRSRLRLLSQHILYSAKRIHGVPEFRLYAAADGIKQLLYNSQRGGSGRPCCGRETQFVLLSFEV